MLLFKKKLQLRNIIQALTNSTIIVFVFQLYKTVTFYYNHFTNNAIMYVIHMFSI